MCFRNSKFFFPKAFNEFRNIFPRSFDKNCNFFYAIRSLNLIFPPRPIDEFFISWFFPNNFKSFVIFFRERLRNLRYFSSTDWRNPLFILLTLWQISDFLRVRSSNFDIFFHCIFIIWRIFQFFPEFIVCLLIYLFIFTEAIW